MGRTANPTVPLLHAILAQGGSKPTHARLAKVAAISARSVDNKLEELRPLRVLDGGHPASLGPGLGMVLALSLGSESMRAALVDANGDLKHECEDTPAPDQLALPPDELLPRLRRLGVAVLRQALDDRSLWSGATPSLRLCGVAVAWPSPIDRMMRPTGSALGDRQWTRTNNKGRIVPLSERVAKEFGPPFTPERSHALNDVNAQALAVAFRAARARAEEPTDSRWYVAMVVRVGGGLGAATILLAPHLQKRLSFIDSRLIAGANGFAGELGHLAVSEKLVEDRNEANPHDKLAELDYQGWRCSCGRRHHLEAFASATGVIARLQASGYEIGTVDRGRTSVVRALFDGDPDQEQRYAVRDAGRLLGCALAGPVLTLDPYSITLTGSLAGEELKQGVLLERETWGHAIGDELRIKYINGGEGAFLAVKGAGLAIIRSHIYRQLEQGVDHIRQRSFEFGERDLEKLAARGTEEHRPT